MATDLHRLEMFLRNNWPHYYFTMASQSPYDTLTRIVVSRRLGEKMSFVLKFSAMQIIAAPEPHPIILMQRAMREVDYLTSPGALWG